MLQANTSSADVYRRTRPNHQTHTEQCHRNTDTLTRARHNAKLDCVIQFNFEEVCGMPLLPYVDNTLWRFRILDVLQLSYVVLEVRYVVLVL